MKKYDLIIIGAGAAGLSAAKVALDAGKKVALLEMGDHPLRKVKISGGGRCNFTNNAASAARYFGKNRDFVRSALAKVKPRNILDWADGHKIAAFEKSPGQYFCKDGSDAIISALLRDANGAEIVKNYTVKSVQKVGDKFIVGDFSAPKIIVATGGISFPALGVSDAGFQIAKQFGHRIEPLKPGLVGLKTGSLDPELSGIALPCRINAKAGREIVEDSVLLTHFGLGGPAAFRASLFDLSAGITVDFLPGVDANVLLKSAKKSFGRKSLAGVLGEHLPSKFAKWISGGSGAKNLADFKDSELADIAGRINRFGIPASALARRGFNSAEVTTGGVDTAEVSSKTFESKLCPGLYFAGEVLDIAGDLGGFNLHFAFASGRIAGGLV